MTREQAEKIVAEERRSGGTVYSETNYWDARVEEYRPPVYRGGLTKREYFAAMAMQGYLIAYSMDLDNDKLAAWSYETADAMLAAGRK